MKIKLISIGLVIVFIFSLMLYVFADPAQGYEDTLSITYLGESSTDKGVYMNIYSSYRKSVKIPVTGFEGKLWWKDMLFTMHESGGRIEAFTQGGIAGDPGGTSYGLYQITGWGIPLFLEYCENNAPEIYHILMPYKAGSVAFGNAWKQACKEYPELMYTAQMDYGWEHWCAPVAEYIFKVAKVDMTSHPALIEMLWSSSVANPNSAKTIISKCVSTDKSAEENVTAICDYYINNTRQIWGSSYSEQTIQNIRALKLVEKNDILTKYLKA